MQIRFELSLEPVSSTASQILRFGSLALAVATVGDVEGAFTISASDGLANVRRTATDNDLNI
jgi:hypothetical protein